MALKDILVVSGQSGLFKYISQGRNNVIVENMCDNKRTTIPATTKISMLENIAIFTAEGNITLREVFKKIQDKENGGVSINHKSPDAELKKYFAELLPTYDRERVYVSDFKKVAQWYNLLHELGITDFEEPLEDSADSSEEKNSAEEDDNKENETVSEN